jgi:NADPH:quinone reductase-like Zn-dependent oxidoreductase
MGAHHVVDHRDLVDAVRAVAPDGVDFVFSPNTEGRIADFAEIVRPGGAITAIDDPQGLDVRPLKSKSITFHWEFMFTRPMYRTADMTAQHDLLEQVAALIDDGAVRTTMTTRLAPLDAATLRRAHELVESGRTIGKTVVALS